MTTTLTAQQVFLSSVHAVSSLTNTEAAMALPVAITATVTYYKKGNVSLFLQEGDEAIYVEATDDEKLAAGDRVSVRGLTEASFRPEVKGLSVRLLGHGVLPHPTNANFKQLIQGQLDCRRVTLHATVRGANFVMDGGVRNIHLQLLLDGGNIDAEVLDNGSVSLSKLMDAEVVITGVVAGKFDTRMQMTGILLEIPSLSDLKIVKLGTLAPWAIPIVPMDEIMKGYDIRDRTRRVRVQGSVTYYQPGTSVVLQRGKRSLWISTQYEGPLRIGNVADVTGFPDVHNGSLSLIRGMVEDTGMSSPIAAMPQDVDGLSLGLHAFELVSVEGRFLTAVREAAQDEYVLKSGDHLFTAIYRHPDRGTGKPPAPMLQIPLGSTIRLTGICIMDSDDRLMGSVAFYVLLRSSEDIAVVASAPLLSVHNLVLLVGLLLLVLMIVGGRAWFVERRQRHRNARLAHVEISRSHILENINGSLPLDQIIREINELVSLQLRGYPCWCILTDGSQLGNCRSAVSGLLVIEKHVIGRNGSSLGKLFVATEPAELNSAVTSDAMQMASCLIAQAIDTRQLYSDLLHRSEFDLLTDMPNRFCFEKRLDTLIFESEQTGGTFGLIYVDVDDFKLVNDLYGHRTGDIYLQKMALRLQHQLRSADTLARLGGDEFALLLPNIGGKKDVEEIRSRLARCFQKPFLIDGETIQGKASMGIALYPEDAIDKDSLLNIADADMYAIKQAKGIRRYENLSMRNNKAVETLIN